MGSVEQTTRDSIILRCIKKVTVKVDEEELTKWAHLLSKGSSVAILALDDGDIRVRALNEAEAQS